MDGPLNEMCRILVKINQNLTKIADSIAAIDSEGLIIDEQFLTKEEE